MDFVSSCFSLSEGAALRAEGAERAAEPEGAFDAACLQIDPKDTLLSRNSETSTSNVPRVLQEEYQYLWPLLHLIVTASASVRH